MKRIQVDGFGKCTLDNIMDFILFAKKISDVLFEINIVKTTMEVVLKDARLSDYNLNKSNNKKNNGR